jgi:regulatory protein
MHFLRKARKHKLAGMTLTDRRVTSLESDRRIPGNIIVELDGIRFSSLPAGIVLSLGLEKHRDLDDALFERLEYAADVEAAYLVAIRILTAMPRAVVELKRRLRQRGHKGAVVEEAVGRLETAGLLDDESFARHFSRMRLARGHGPPRILTDLLSRGVERRLAEHAVDEVLEAEEIDPTEAARVLAEKRSAQLGDLPADTKKRRMLAYLGRRGFRGYEVTEIVEEVLSAVE